MCNPAAVHLMLSKSTLLKLDNFRRGAPTRVKDSGSGVEMCSPHTKRTV